MINLMDSAVALPIKPLGLLGLVSKPTYTINIFNLGNL